VWPELVDQMVHVDKQQTQIFYLFRTPWTVRTRDQQVHQIEKIDEQRMVELFKLFAAIKVLWIQAFKALRFERSNYVVIVGKWIAKHRVGVGWWQRGFGGSCSSDIFIAV
jgi:hypothetical protein